MLGEVEETIYVVEDDEDEEETVKVSHVTQCNVIPRPMLINWT